MGKKSTASGKKKKGAKKQKPKTKTNLPVGNDLSKGKEQLPPNVESSSHEDSSDSEGKVIDQKSDAASENLEQPAGHASKNEGDNNSSDKDDDPKTHASSSEATEPKGFTVPKERTLIVGNLSHNVDKEQLTKFFEDAGEIVEIRISTFDDGTCKGLAQVEFATDEAVEKACKLSGSQLMGRAVTLNFGQERLTVSPLNSSFKKPAHLSVNTVLIQGFDAAYDMDPMTSLVRSRFKSCGVIRNIFFVKHIETGANTGALFMEFANHTSVTKALKLDGSDLGGFSLSVAKAKHED